MGLFNNSSRPYWPLIPIIIITMGIMVWMNAYMPPANLAPYGYSSVIIAMEFPFTPQDVHAVLDPLSEVQIAGLDMVNKIDFAYMVLYSLWIAGFFFITRKMENERYLQLGMGLAGAAFFSDMLENFSLLDLTDLYRDQIGDIGYESVISNILIFTSMKWGALALAMALAVPTLIKRGIFSKIIAFILSLPLVFLVVAAISQSPKTIDMFANTIILGFLALAVYIMGYRHVEPA